MITNIPSPLTPDHSTTEFRRHVGAVNRPTVDGKFLRVDGRRFLVKGVAYGTFAPDAHGYQFPSPDRTAADFSMMEAHGINTVRTYTCPSEALLDEAARCGLKVMVGLPWSQHVAFLDDRRLRREIRKSLREQVRMLSSHPAALLFSIGNEIPAPIVRWHGRLEIERFLWEVYQEVKSAASEALLTYVNYPPTDFLDLSFLDVCAFNVFLHREKDMGAYLNRLQILAGHKPLLVAEAGGDSVREGLDGQAGIVAMQIRSAFARGACGAVAFAWTDEWWRGGSPVEDWAFGLVDVHRVPKPALSAAERAFADAPFPESDRCKWPSVSVAICAYNAQETIDECLNSVAALTYPHIEILVVNDGSRDATGEIARRHPRARVIDVPNGGLSAARNVALAHATGEIIAYTDADVRVDPEWLTYLVQPLVTSHVAGAGGPNLVPADDPWMAQCVARAPGGPTHVLLTDRLAEHVPGCNMAFRREALLAVGGFNPIFLRAGDDVDICWRLQAMGYRIAFAPSALVWHHHRGSLRAYWKQQVGYGEGEGWLMARHPEKFEGHRPVWRGRIYSPLPYVRSLSRAQVNSGTWGTALFPSIYRRDAYAFAYMPHRFRWQALSFGLMGAGVLAMGVGRTGAGFWLLFAGLLALSTTLFRCFSFANRSDLDRLPPVDGYSRRLSRVLYTAAIGWLHFVQPFARVAGRLRAAGAPGGPLLPRDRRGVTARRLSFREYAASARLLCGLENERNFWSESWVDVASLLSRITDELKASRMLRSIEVDDGWHADWDIRIGVRGVGSLDLRAVIEDHGSGRCLARVATRLRLGKAAFMATYGMATFIVGVALGVGLGSFAATGMALAVMALVTVVTVGWQTTRAAAGVGRAVQRAAWGLGLSPMEGSGELRPRVREQERQETSVPADGVPLNVSSVTGVPSLLAGHQQRHDEEQL